MTSKEKTKHFVVEGERTVELDLLDAGVTVTLALVNGDQLVSKDGLLITVKVSHGPEASSWDLHEFQVPLPRED